MSTKNEFTPKAIARMCTELSLLLHAGVSSADALHLLAEGEEDKEAREVLTSAADAADDGASVSAALRDTGRFPAYVSGLLEVGEHSGRMEEALNSLARYYDERERMSRRVRSAILYPAVMLVLMLAVIVILLVKVLPIFDDVYASLGGRLTGVAGGLLALGKGLGAIMPVLCGVIIAVVVVCLLFAVVPAFREKLTAAFRSGRGDKGLFRQMNNARLVQAMAMGMRSGLPAEEAVALAANLMTDSPEAQKRCRACQEALDGGARLSDALKETGVLDAGMCRLLELSQRSGSADAALEQLALELSEDSQAALEDAVSRIEPALVLVCSVLVGLILLSVMLPLMHIMAAIG